MGFWEKFGGVKENFNRWIEVDDGFTKVWVHGGDVEDGDWWMGF